MSAVSERAAIVALVAGTVYRENGRSHGGMRGAIADAVQVAEGIVQYATERHPVEPAEPITRS